MIFCGNTWNFAGGLMKIPARNGVTSESQSTGDDFLVECLPVVEVVEVVGVEGFALVRDAGGTEDAGGVQFRRA